ncbi:hypothetical protein TWF696_000235 [Orbilia brochopaga]|uniref:Uncharacterized protein n=1 Tax=Orbilia brochopaga TaxID=3140254 RepID=A0AAV9VD55_9PEZI
MFFEPEGTFFTPGTQIAQPRPDVWPTRQTETYDSALAATVQSQRQDETRASSSSTDSSEKALSDRDAIRREGLTLGQAIIYDEIPNSCEFGSGPTSTQKPPHALNEEFEQTTSPPVCSKTVTPGSSVLDTKLQILQTQALLFRTLAPGAPSSIFASWIQNFTCSAALFMQEIYKLQPNSHLPQNEREKVFDWNRASEPNNIASHQDCNHEDTVHTFPEDSKIPDIIACVLEAFCFLITEGHANPMTLHLIAAHHPMFKTLGNLWTRIQRFDFLYIGKLTTELPKNINLSETAPLDILRAVYTYTTFIEHFRYEAQPNPRVRSPLARSDLYLLEPFNDWLAAIYDVAAVYKWQHAVRDLSQIAVWGLRAAEKKYGPDSVHALTALALLMRLNHMLGYTQDAEKWSRRIVLGFYRNLLSTSIAQIVQDGDLLAEVLLIMKAQLDIGRPEAVSQTANFFEEALGTLTRKISGASCLDEEDAGDSDRSPISEAAVLSCLSFRVLKAAAYSDQRYYPESLKIIHETLQIFQPGRSSHIDISYHLVKLNNLAIEVMTRRGLVRYFDPLPENLIKFCKEKDNPKQNPFYHSTIFMTGSMLFRGHFDGNVWKISPLVRPASWPHNACWRKKPLSYEDLERHFLWS